MPVQYYPVSRSEIESFLALYSEGKAEEVAWQGERVYRWEVEKGLYLQVYSSIEENSAKARGEDAIHVVVLASSSKGLVPLGKTKRVHRTLGWKDNLRSRLEKWKEFLTPECPRCATRTALRRNRATQEEFYGCLDYPECKGTVSWKAY